MESCTFMFHVVFLKRNECSQFWGEEQHSMKLKFLFLKILFEWTSASHMFSITDFLEFLLTLFFFILAWGFPLYISCVLGLHPFHLFFNGFYYLSKRLTRELLDCLTM